ncbi:MAG: AsmA family protein [Rhodobacteraceae bacterium]|nr:AsmA family protein [Paracoccaceae bacterium]
MNVWIKRIGIALIAVIGVVVIGGWLLLSSSLLAQPRGNLVARMLTDQLGQQVEIQGGVSVSFGGVTHVTTEDLILPSPAMPQTDLASIHRLEFDISLRDLLKGKVDLGNIRVDGADIAMIVEADGKTSWTAGSMPPVARQKQPDRNNSLHPSQILAGHTVSFTNATLLYQDARNGLDMTVALEQLDLGQADTTAPITLTAQGAVNGQDMTLKGQALAGEPFDVSMDFDGISLSVDGEADDQGLTAQLNIDISALGQLLDVLKLNRVLEGTGQISATFTSAEGSQRIEDLSVVANLDSGQSVEVTGDVGQLGDPTDVSIDTKIRLYPPDNMPPATNSRRDLKLTEVDMGLIAQPNGIPQRTMVIATNGFVLETEGEGEPPISVSGISRTPEGNLKLGELVLRIGPPEAPFLILDGSVSNALELKDIAVDADIELSAGSLIAPELLQGKTELGHVSGGFQLTGSAQELALTGLEANSRDTDLWHLTVTGSVGNALTFSDVNLDIAADVPSGAELLTAMNLEPVETGPVELKTSVANSGLDWDASASVTVDVSEMLMTLDLDIEEDHPTVRGQVESDLIRMEHLRDITNAAIQLGRLGKMETEARGTPPETPDEDGERPLKDVTLRPIGQALLLSGMDLEIGIDLRKIEGEKGETSMTSQVVLRDEKAQLGPLKFEYGGGNFDVTGVVDLEESPDVIQVSGSTGGWDFGNIMHALKFKKGASGVLYANFDVSGHHSSARDFLSSMSGAATISMRNGSIDTQLLDLAGLGVIPWLFSKHKGPTAPIVCVNAPFALSNGTISTKQTTVETDKVQVVVYGDVDLNGNTINVVGQPRKIGKPLSRSPWPFTAQGPLKKPDIKVKDGPKRLKRTDGASKMPDERKLCVPDILQLQ